ncbi:M1 family metallopeptidase [Polyangium jinanense]|uniref:Peptidase M1 n=1 Tax=Polyangium jinanense TaxID=2829994 RepID=A0A9X3XHJ3_9BACT|nr:M1 family aminopeptidase [Polyangium jinanense]MDC3958173.1 peptidase M1 [Polyangium jinanense]MDC3988141.1 peptidase M1 [Polyangium jinanense]
MKHLFTLAWASIPLFLLAGCGDGGEGPEPGPIPVAPTENLDRDILSTALALDVTAMTGEATIDLAPAGKPGASFEVAGLVIQSVEDASGQLEYAVQDGRLDVGVKESAENTTLQIKYAFTTQKNFDGYLAEELTFLWPRFCGNLFPCKSVPSEGVKFEMTLSGVPMGKDAVFPAEIPADAPTYMPAFALGEYTHVALGTTTAGTKVSVYHLPGEEAAATEGTKDLAAVFDWLEKTYGAYSFGGEVGSVSAKWGPGAYGGMEHHPYWHVGSDSMNDPVTHAHEAAHGWFGNGVRIACWEDFVLSEGTVSYLAARGLEAVGGTAVGEAIWSDYQTQLDAVIMEQDTVLMLDTCNTIDLITHPLWSTVTYMKGAFFYRAVEAQVGRDKLDAALAKFYGTFKNRAARMQDMIDTIEAETGADISVHVNGWLKGLGKP